MAGYPAGLLPVMAVAGPGKFVVLISLACMRCGPRPHREFKPWRGRLACPTPTPNVVLDTPYLVCPSRALRPPCPRIRPESLLHKSSLACMPKSGGGGLPPGFSRSPYSQRVSRDMHSLASACLQPLDGDPLPFLARTHTPSPIFSDTIPLKIEDGRCAHVPWKRMDPAIYGCFAVRVAASDL